MARSLSRNAYHAHPVMNVTPLVDVMLVLLIIFMVVIPMMEKSAKVELPKIFNVDPEAKGKNDPFTLSIIADGTMFFEQDQTTPEQLTERLRQANDEDPTKRLVVRADKDTNYGKVRALFKICQEIGFPGVSMRVNEIKTSKD